MSRKSEKKVNRRLATGNCQKAGMSMPALLSDAGWLIPLPYVAEYHPLETLLSDAGWLTPLPLDILDIELH